MTRKLRMMVRPMISGLAGQAVGFGVRVGYWPCLKAPYLTVSLWRWHIDIWHGYPSYVDV